MGALYILKGLKIEPLIHGAGHEKGMRAGTENVAGIVGLGKAPSICILDPDGDIVSNLLAKKRAKLNPNWPCYHTELYNFVNEEMEFGIIGGAVGASFAVLVAEELFASGCRLVISLTSSGQILPIEKPPYFILIEMALRDEGTSYHYLPP